MESCSNGESNRKLYLVINRPKINIGFQWFTGDTTCEHVLPGIIEPVLDQDPRHVFYLKGAPLSRSKQKENIRNEVPWTRQMRFRIEVCRTEHLPGIGGQHIAGGEDRG